jgi:type I restriction enzyme S subunit
MRSTTSPNPSATYLLGEIATIKYGKAKPADLGDVPVIGSGGTYGYTSKPLADEKAIIVGRKGTAGSVHFPNIPSWPSDTTFFVQPNAEIVEPEFLACLLKTAQLSGEHARTTMPSLQISQLTELQVHLPSLDEQRLISSKIGVVRTAIEAFEVESRAVAALRDSLLKKLLRDAEGSSKVVELQSIARIERGRFTHRPRNDPNFYGGDIPFIQTGDITRSACTGGKVRTHSQSLNARGLAVSRLFPSGTIAITIAANIGYTAMLTFPAAFPDSIIAITPDETIDADFLNVYLSTQQAEMDRRAPKGTQKNINIEFLRPWPIVVPVLEIQRSIARSMNLVEDELAACVHEATALRVLLDSISFELLETAL